MYPTISPTSLEINTNYNRTKSDLILFLFMIVFAIIILAIRKVCSRNNRIATEEYII